MLEEQVEALDEGRAFVDGSGLRAIEVTGGDAARWLNDLVTAGVEELPEGAAARSLLLTPTGRMRADVHVARTPNGFLLLQESDQSGPIDELLQPYVLTSDVALRRVDAGARVVLLPAGREGWAVAWEPPDGAVEAGAEAAEAWRIRRGIPRFPPDLDEESLPAEGGLEFLIDFTKGCFLGQEAVAKVRNLGHPQRTILALRAAGPVQPGEPVLAEGRQVGTVTSAASSGEGFALLARVRWEARSAPVATASSGHLAPA
jgi:folate-binding protein YgfZ